MEKCRGLKNLKTKNPKLKICPFCDSVSIHKRRDKGFKNSKQHLTGKPMLRSYIGVYICERCGEIFEQPKILIREV